MKLEHGDLQRITKITKMRKLGPKKKGFSYDYVKRCMDKDDPRSNDDITAIARDLVQQRDRSMQALGRAHQ